MSNQYEFNIYSFAIKYFKDKMESFGFIQKKNRPYYLKIINSEVALCVFVSKGLYKIADIYLGIIPLFTSFDNIIQYDKDHFIDNRGTMTSLTLRSYRDGFRENLCYGKYFLQDGEDYLIKSFSVLYAEYIIPAILKIKDTESAIRHIETIHHWDNYKFPERFFEFVLFKENYYVEIFIQNTGLLEHVIKNNESNLIIGMHTEEEAKEIIEHYKDKEYWLPKFEEQSKKTLEEICTFFKIKL